MQQDEPVELPEGLSAADSGGDPPPADLPQLDSYDDDYPGGDAPPAPPRWRCWAHRLGSGSPYGYSKLANLLPGTNPAEALSEWGIMGATAALHLESITPA